MMPLEVGWVAGLLEGEGCFSLGSRKHGDKTYHYPRVQCIMTDPDVLNKLAQYVGVGNVSGPTGYNDPKRSHYKDRYHWAIYSQNAIDLMIAIYPHMGVRRQEKIEEVLSR